MYKWPSWYRSLYDQYWWKGLWKIIAKDMSLSIPNLHVPSTYCVKISDILSWENLGDFNFWNTTDVVIKFSKIWDDFSNESSRWKNTSLWLPKIKSWENIEDCLRDVISTQNITDDVKAIILDEMIKVWNWLLFLVIFEWNLMKLEISKNDRERLYYIIDTDWEIISFEKNSDQINHNDIPFEVFETMLRIHKSIYQYFWNSLSINTEWFFEKWNYIMIQVRPTPNETTSMEDKLPDWIIYSSEIIDTNFVYWTFDYEGFPEIINEFNHLSENSSIFILDENIRWYSPLIKERLEKWLPTILIDTHDWFHISHDPKLLPNSWIYRERFNYISYFPKTNIVWKKIRVISTWEKWRVLVYKENNMSKDKFEARNLKKRCNFTYHSSDFNFPKHNVTSTWVVIFDDYWDLLTVELKRWFDIPWWHVQEWDKSFEDAVSREALEEACVYIKDLKLSLVVESDYFGDAPDKLTYMLFYTAKVNKLEDFVANSESTSRKFMSPEKFIEDFKWDKELISNIVRSAILFSK